jgi:hypothetical protein
VGTSAIAGVLHERRVAGADKERRYTKLARERITAAAGGKLKIREMNQPVYQPTGRESVAKNPFIVITSDQVHVAAAK